MCFSENASIVSFTFGVIGSLLCISLGTVTDKIVGFFMLFVSSMQGIEYLLWRHQICDNYNKFISILGMVLNHLQPIVLGFIVILFNTKLTQSKLHLIYSFMTVYLFVIIPYSIKFLKDPQLLCTIKNKETTHLQWNWTDMKYFDIVYTVFLIAFCAFFLLGLPKLQYGIYASLTAIITSSTSLYFYPQKHTGAIWCYYVVFLPIIYYLMRKIIFF
jgi:hypothetical protein